MAVGEARSSRSTRAEDVRFEVVRSVLVPAHEQVAVLELEGTFHASARRSVGRPRLVVTAGGESVEVKALDAQPAHAGPKPKPWSAAFPIPRAVTDADGATYALAIGRSLTLDLPAPVHGTLPAQPQDEVEGQTWGSMVVDLSETRRELAGAQTDLARAHEEIERLRTEAETARAELDAATAEPPRPRVTWLDEVEAEAAASTNGDGPHHEEDDPADALHDDDEATASPLPVLAGRRVNAPPTTEHEAVYEATLKRIQADRRVRMRRRRIWGRILALLVFLLAAAAIYIVVTGAVGVDLLEIF
ncbi:MAG: hypothetical protein ACSLFR_10745 [Solirubrobacteraceae bacterium]